MILGGVPEGSNRAATTRDAGVTTALSPVDEALSLLTRAQALADRLHAASAGARKPRAHARR